MKQVGFAVLVLMAFAIGLVAGRATVMVPPLDVGMPLDSTNPGDITVLDADTLVVGKEVVQIAGIDAPELGPKAKCWAEAALAGHARREVENLVFAASSRGGWRVFNPQGRDNHGRLIASLRRDDGEDLADVLRVGGYAARISSAWDWCGHADNLHAPEGPNLWYPTGRMYDERAYD